MNAYIARDGEELGEFQRSDIEELARAGELRPTDYYWHEGMENWVLLEDLLGPDPWRPPPSLRSQLPLAGGVLAALVLAGLIAIYFVNATGAGGRSRTGRRPETASSTLLLDPAKERELRDRAAAELRQRIESLPGRPAPPLYTFFYDVAVQMRRSLSPPALWEAMVRGSENAVDPATEQTLRRTEFTLVTEYRDGAWAFKHYKSSTRNLAEPGQSEEEHDAHTATPPALVTMLGLKIETPLAEGR